MRKVKELEKNRHATPGPKGHDTRNSIHFEKEFNTFILDSALQPESIVSLYVTAFILKVGIHGNLNYGITEIRKYGIR